MLYAQRNGGGQIIGLFANLQPGYAEEEISEDAAEVVAFKAAAEQRLAGQ